MYVVSLVLYEKRNFQGFLTVKGAEGIRSPSKKLFLKRIRDFWGYVIAILCSSFSGLSEGVNGSKIMASSYGEFTY